MKEGVGCHKNLVLCGVFVIKARIISANVPSCNIATVCVKTFVQTEMITIPPNP
jgi:hypothetical protein